MSESEGEKQEQPKAKRKTKIVKSATARKDAFAGDYIDLILAGRTKKVSVEIPHVVMPTTCFNPRKIVLKQKDYDHLMGETDGTKYDYHGRPELDTLIVGLTDDPKVPKNIMENNADVIIPFDETRMVMLLYDIGREIYILTDAVHDRLLLLLYESLHPSSNNKPLSGPIPTSLGRIKESRKEENEDQDDDEHPTIRKKQILSIVQSYYYIGNDKYYTPIDMTRLRVWRRFSNVHLQPLVEDEDEMRHARKRYAKEQKKLWKVRNNIPSDTDSTSTESTKSTTKKGKKSKKGKKKDSSGKKSKSGKSKSKKKQDSDSDSDDSDSESENTSNSSVDERKLTKEQIAAAAAKAAKVNMQHLNRRPLINSTKQ